MTTVTRSRGSHRGNLSCCLNVTLDELELAPEEVRRVLADLPPEQVEIVQTPQGSDEVRNIWKPGS